jgi:hypothetical protein
VLVGVAFDPALPDTSSMAIMRGVATKQNMLVIYNENVGQYEDKGDLSPGAGNGVLRQFRLDAANYTIGARSATLGIPTDTIDASIIKRAVDLIRRAVVQNRVAVVVWSVEHPAGGGPSRIGLGVFKDLPDAKLTQKRVSDELRSALVQGLGYKEIDFNPPGERPRSWSEFVVAAPFRPLVPPT